MRLDKWFADLGICDSISEARRLIEQGAMAFNKEKIPRDTKYVYFGYGKYVLSPINIEAIDQYKEWLDDKEKS